MLNSDEIKDNTINHMCSNCGECCGLFIPFTDKELKILKEYVKQHNIQPINRISAENLEARCCFYDSVNKKCLVYDVRPYVCRNFKCDHKDWRKRRDSYEKRAKYNSTVNSKIIIGTFDDLIYDDYRPIMIYIMSMLRSNLNDKVRHQDLYTLLQHLNRLDILNHIKLN